MEGQLRAKLESYVSAGGRLILGGTAALDRETGEFGLSGVPVAYEGQAPTVPSYLRLDEALADDTELATDYDYVFYNRAMPSVWKAPGRTGTYGAGSSTGRGSTSRATPRRRSASHWTLRW